jgi:peptidoglycan hydrolase-like protein with peptidoglycan-binding domain
MVLPVPGYKVTTRWGIPGSWAAGRHTGEDYAAPTGARVVTAAAGTVIYSGRGGGWGAAYGEHIIIDSGSVRHMYAHLSRRRIGYGAKVAAGTHIGDVGSTGDSTGPHLHYEERTSPFAYANKDREPLFSKTSGGGTTPTCFGDYCYGKSAPAHRALQRRLADKGHRPDWGSNGPTDYYGNATKASVAAFQRAQGWSGSGADGLMGPSTCSKLGLPERLQHRSSRRIYASKMRIGQGDSDSVWNVQVALLLRGYSIPDGPTDYFGQQTNTAVAAFQRDQGWSGGDADGIPGPGTVKALGLQWVQDIEEPKPPPVEPVPPPAGQPDDMPPNAIWEPIKGFNGLRPFVDGGGAKIVLHTTESSSKPNWEALGSGIPHFTFDPASGQVWQHLPLDVAAYTLMGGTHSPNSAAGVSIQIEIIGFAKDTPGKDDRWYERLRGLLLWIAAKIGAQYVFPFPWAGNAGYGEGGEVRQTWTAYRAATGIVGHSHVPYNNHWDPGELDVSRLSDRVEPEPPPVDPPPAGGEFLTVADFDEWRVEVARVMAR